MRWFIQILRQILSMFFDSILPVTGRMNAIILYDPGTRKYSVLDHNVLDVIAKERAITLRKGQRPAYVMDQTTVHPGEAEHCKICARTVWLITCNNVTRSQNAKSS